MAGLSRPHLFAGPVVFQFEKAKIVWPFRVSGAAGHEDIACAEAALETMGLNKKIEVAPARNTTIRDMPIKEN